MKKKIRVKKIKICCEMMRDYFDSNVKVSQGHAVIDTDMEMGNEIDIDYCPWCGKKIEYKFAYIKEQKCSSGKSIVPEVWSEQLLKSLDTNKKLVFNMLPKD